MYKSHKKAIPHKVLQVDFSAIARDINLNFFCIKCDKAADNLMDKKNGGGPLTFLFK